MAHLGQISNIAILIAKMIKRPGVCFFSRPQAFQFGSRAVPFARSIGTADIPLIICIDDVTPGKFGETLKAVGAAAATALAAAVCSISTHKRCSHTR